MKSVVALQTLHSAVAAKAIYGQACRVIHALAVVVAATARTAQGMMMIDPVCESTRGLLKVRGSLLWV